MLSLLSPSNYAFTGRLFQPLDEHLTITSILEGLTPGEIAVDDPNHPTCAAAWFRHKFFLAGDPEPGFITALAEYFHSTLLPEAKNNGQEIFILMPASPIWKNHYPAIFGSAFSRQVDALRETYTFTAGKNALIPAWRDRMPEEFCFSAVDAGLLSQAHLKHSAYLVDETQSERTSVQDFLAQSFGVCLRNDETLAAWCLSEYNHGTRCEVGIATVDEYQRRGFGTLAGCAFLEEAIQRGYREIGWHCWKNNQASAALARKLGFSLFNEYEVTLGFITV